MDLTPYERRIQAALGKNAVVRYEYGFDGASASEVADDLSIALHGAACMMENGEPGTYYVQVMEEWDGAEATYHPFVVMSHLDDVSADPAPIRDCENAPVSIIRNIAKELAAAIKAQGGLY